MLAELLGEFRRRQAHVHLVGDALQDAPHEFARGRRRRPDTGGSVVHDHPQTRGGKGQEQHLLVGEPFAEQWFEAGGQGAGQVVGGRVEQVVVGGGQGAEVVAGEVPVEHDGDPAQHVRTALAAQPVRREDLLDRSLQVVAERVVPVGRRVGVVEDRQPDARLGPGQLQADAGASFDGHAEGGEQRADVRDVGHHAGAAEPHLEGEVLRADRHLAAQQAGEDPRLPPLRVVEGLAHRRQALTSASVGPGVHDEQAVTSIGQADGGGTLEGLVEVGDLGRDGADPDAAAPRQLLPRRGVGRLQLAQDGDRSIHLSSFRLGPLWVT